MNKKSMPWFLCSLLLLINTGAIAGDSAPAAPSSSPVQADEGIALPADNDDYSRLVRLAQSGDESVDFRAMRLAYIKSAAFLRSGKHQDEILRLRKEMSAGLAAKDDLKVRTAARGILGIQYLDLDAHKLLRQACAAMHDDLCAAKHHFIEFGLLTSIMRTGDSASCETGWEVVTIDEEYFILRMRGAKLQKQSLAPGGGNICDQMQVLDEKGNTRTYFFKVNAVFEGYKRLGIP